MVRAEIQIFVCRRLKEQQEIQKELAQLEEKKAEEAERKASFLKFILLAFKQQLQRLLES